MTVRIERDGAVWTVIVDRPEVRNAVDRETAEALADAFEAFETDPRARVGVLTGAGGTFCSGADLKAIAAGTPNRLQPDGRAPLGPSRLRLSKPVIAAIAGHAVAGGLELALWCDLRIAEEGAVLGVFCRRWGVPLIDGGTARLPHVVGLGRALDLVLTGRRVEAREALEIGLVNRLVPAGRARAEAETLAGELAALPWDCLVSDRRAVYDGLGRPPARAMEREFRHGVETIRRTGLADVAGFVAGDDL